jgi:hypothetical protein
MKGSKEREFFMVRCALIGFRRQYDYCRVSVADVS